MKLITTKNYNKQLKKLKKHDKEMENLYAIKEFLINTTNFKELFKTPMAKMYGFEQLKHNLNKYYSFNLNKNGGVIRLIVYPIQEDICLCFISFNHYDDFNPATIEYDE